MIGEGVISRENTPKMMLHPVHSEQYLSVQPAMPTKDFHTSSEIIRQTLVDTTSDDIYSVKNFKGSRNPVSPSISNIGFQSIFQTADHPRSKFSVASNDSLKSNDEVSAISGRSKSSQIGEIKTTDSKEYSNNLAKQLSTDAISVGQKSLHSTSSSSYIKRKASGFLSRRGRAHTAISSDPASFLTTSSTLHNNSHSFRNVIKNFFQNKNHRHIGQDTIEPAIPNSLSKFLHSSYGRHKSPSQFIHTNAGQLVDSGTSVYSLNVNPSCANSNSIIVDPFSEIDPTSPNPVSMLHDLLRNLSSLEANYKHFNSQELTTLTNNIWNIFCSNVAELFRTQRIWKLRAKIEDFNEVLEFYCILKTDPRVSNGGMNRIVSDLKEFLVSSLYSLENQIVFNYSNEDTINNALKRLGVIWRIFYQEVYYDLAAVLLPLDRTISDDGDSTMLKLTNESRVHIGCDFSIGFLLLKCFRDSIVLPCYENFVTSNDGISRSFQLYIFNQEEENNVTETDKLTLLQCFGILSTIQSADRNQRIIDELLTGIRMSI
ncbi:Bit61p [Saccharomyces eubayanus]|uniref:Bit61p n=1 Tax=Saccharomyces eubayanus TaxID=1080349 RepID=UPI0006C28C2A|nr:BIT61-like protein [Saccharomyces eubayanus]KOG98547.1 BIT61-like protein [Saccharomyces eubayanus]